VEKREMVTIGYQRSYKTTTIVHNFSEVPMRKAFFAFKLFQIFIIVLCLFFPLAVSLRAAETTAGQTQESMSQTSEKKLPLSLKDIVIKSLEKNLDIAIERYNPDIQQTDITKEKSVFDPLFTTTFTKAEEISPSTARTIRFGGPASVDEETNTLTGSLSKKFVTGTEVSADLDFMRTADTFNNFDSEYESTVSMTLTQPLLRNFGIGVNKTNIYVAQNNKTISDDTFREKVMEIISEAEQTYWELVFRINDLKVKQKSLRLAQELLAQNKIQVEVGTLAPIEIVQAQARIAAREEDVIVAQDAIQDAEDSLKRIINLGENSDAWNIRIVPTDSPSFDTVRVSLAQSIKTAFENRPDYARQKKELENSRIRSTYANNQVLPKLDFVAKGGYNALRGNIGNTVDDLSATKNPLWALGVEVEVPILNREARSQRTRRKLEVEQAKTTLKNLELKVIEEVRGAVRQIQTDIKRVQATKAARILAEKQLDAEVKKYEAGISTNFNVLQYQSDLATAESNEAQAIVDYNKSLVELDRILGTLLDKNNVYLKKS